MKLCENQIKQLKEFAETNQQLLKECSYDPFETMRPLRKFDNFTFEIRGSKFMNDKCVIVEAFVNDYCIQYGEVIGYFKRNDSGVFELTDYKLRRI